MLLPTSPPTAGPSRTATSTGCPTSSPSGLAGRGVGAGDVRRAGAAQRPRVPVRVPGRGEARCRHGGRERATRTGGARRDPRDRAAAPRPRLRRPRARRWDVEVVDAAATVADVATTLRVAGEAPAERPYDPDDPVAILFTSGTTGLPKGALFCAPPARVHHPDRRRRRLGHGWARPRRDVDGAPRVHDEAAGQPPARRHQLHDAALARRRGAAHLGRATDDHDRRRARAVRARCCASPTSTCTTSTASRSSSPAVGRSPPTSPRRPVRASTPRCRRATRAPRRASGSAPPSTIRAEDAVLSVGRPHPAVELALLDEDDRPVPAGEVGQVCLRSPAVMAGYWRDPEATRAAFTADGFVRTGDLGWLDDADRLRLVGRSKEMYVRGGYNVYPVEVEAVLSTHPGVAAVAVVPACRRRHGRGRRGRGRARATPARRRRWRRCATTPPARSPATSSPRTCGSSTTCRSPRWRRSTGGRCVATWRRPANLTPPSWNSSSPPNRTSCATPCARCSSASAR